MIRPVADLAIAACGGAAAGAVFLQDPTKEYGPLAVVVIMVGGMFAIAHRVAGIVDKRLGELNTTITRQGEQIMQHTERGAEVIHASKEAMDTLRRGVDEAREDRRRLTEKFDGLATWLQAKIGELLARKQR